MKNLTKAMAGLLSEEDRFYVARLLQSRANDMIKYGEGDEDELRRIDRLANIFVEGEEGDDIYA